MITLLLLACLSPELITSAVDCDRSADVDCDGIIGLWDCDDTDPDIGAPDRYYPDEDMDGYGVWDGAIGACEHPGDGWVDCLGLTWDLEPCPEMDCDDTDPDIGPDCPP